MIKDEIVKGNKKRSLDEGMAYLSWFALPKAIMSQRCLWLLLLFYRACYFCRGVFSLLGGKPNDSGECGLAACQSAKKLNYQIFRRLPIPGYIRARRTHDYVAVGQTQGKAT